MAGGATLGRASVPHSLRARGLITMAAFVCATVSGIMTICQLAAFEASPRYRSIDRLSSIKWEVGYTEGYRLRILGVVTYVLVVARTGTPTVPTALWVPYGYAPAVTRVIGPTIAMSVTILKL